jgi:hypothetical protein
MTSLGGSEFTGISLKTWRNRALPGCSMRYFRLSANAVGLDEFFRLMHILYPDILQDAPERMQRFGDAYMVCIVTKSKKPSWILLGIPEWDVPLLRRLLDNTFFHICSRSVDKSGVFLYEIEVHDKPKMDHWETAAWEVMNAYFKGQMRECREMIGTRIRNFMKLSKERCPRYEENAIGNMHSYFIFLYLLIELRGDAPISKEINDALKYYVEWHFRYNHPNSEEFAHCRFFLAMRARKDKIWDDATMNAIEGAKVFGSLKTPGALRKRDWCLAFKAKCELESGKKEEAKRVLPLLANSTDPYLCKRLADMALELDECAWQYRYLISSCTHLMDTSPEHVITTRIQLTRMYVMLGAYDLAKKHFRALIKERDSMTPENVQSFERLNEEIQCTSVEDKTHFLCRGCDTVFGRSERGLSVVCRNCRIAHYCSVACQESHAQSHKRHCRKCHGCARVIPINESARRCSQCLTAVYCNAECQLVHWNEKGHKNACVPPPTETPTEAVAQEAAE